MDIVVTQPIKPYKTSSRPWLVKCNDDQKYIVKFSNQDNSFANESVCHAIANKIGLKTTPSFPILIEQDEIDIINKRKIEEKEPVISVGKYFASKFVEEPYTLNEERHKALHPSEIKNLDQVPGMIAFDIFVANSDRQHKNALMHPADNKTSIFEYVLIDHGHCFDGPTWTAASISKTPYQLRNIPWKTDRIIQKSSFISFIDALDSLDASFFIKTIENIPDDWKHKSADFDELLKFLVGRNAKEVLRVIYEQAKNNRNLFPNLGDI